MPQGIKLDNERDVYIYSNNNELKELLKTLKSGTGLTNRDLVRQMIEEVAASDRLREKVQDYYHSFGATWQPDGGPRQLIFLRQDERTLALASTLAYQLLGNGSFSELGRLLIRYYASAGHKTGKYLSATRKPAARTYAPVSRKSNVVRSSLPKSEDDGKPKNATSYTLDEETVSLLDLLVRRMHMKNNELVSSLIEKYMANQDLLEELRLSPAWSAQIAGVHPVIKRFNLSPLIQSLLTKASYKTMGTKKKSAMIRAFIRIEADLQGLRATTPRQRRTNA